MEISGRLTQVLPTQTGTGRNGEWKKCNFVIEIPGKFPRKVCLTAWKELIDQVQQISVGSELQVSFDLESREYNGRWYTDVKAWKINVGNAASPTQEAPPPMDEPPGSDTDDLPF